MPDQALETHCPRLLLFPTLLSIKQLTVAIFKRHQGSQQPMAGKATYTMH